jgi:hypothetical protein
MPAPAYAKCGNSLLPNSEFLLIYFVASEGWPDRDGPKLI